MSRILSKPNFHYRIHISSLPVPLLSQMKPIHTLLSYSCSISLNVCINPPFMPRSSRWTLHLVFPNKNPVNVPHPHTFYMPIHHIVVYLNTRKKLGELYKSWSYSLCNFLHSLVTSSLLGPNILLSTPFSNALKPRSSLHLSLQVPHPFKIRSKNHSSVYVWIFYVFMHQTGRHVILDSKHCLSAIWSNSFRKAIRVVPTKRSIAIYLPPFYMPSGRRLEIYLVITMLLVPRVVFVVLASSTRQCQLLRATGTFDKHL
jgi:hypothetical protein